MAARRFFLTTGNHKDFEIYVNEHAKVSEIEKELHKKFQEYHHEG